MRRKGYSRTLDKLAMENEELRRLLHKCQACLTQTYAGVPVTQQHKEKAFELIQAIDAEFAKEPYA